MRSLGQFARVEELNEMLLEIDVDGSHWSGVTHAKQFLLIYFEFCFLGDGNVSFEEFVDIMSNMTGATAESSADQEDRELRDAFRVFDKHNRGYITASDLRAVLQCLGEDLDEDESKFIYDIIENTIKVIVYRLQFPVEDMIKEVDVDGDGRIDFYEFVHALGEPEDSQENEDDEELFSPLPVVTNECDDSLSQWTIHGLIF